MTNPVLFTYNELSTTMESNNGLLPGQNPFLNNMNLSEFQGFISDINAQMVANNGTITGGFDPGEAEMLFGMFDGNGDGQLGFIDRLQILNHLTGNGQGGNTDLEMDLEDWNDLKGELYTDPTPDVGDNPELYTDLGLWAAMNSHTPGGAAGDMNAQQFSSFIDEINNHMTSYTNAMTGEFSASERQMMFDNADLDGDGVLNPVERQAFILHLTDGDNCFDLNDWNRVKGEVW